MVEFIKEAHIGVSVNGVLHIKKIFIELCEDKSRLNITTYKEGEG